MKRVPRPEGVGTLYQPGPPLKAVPDRRKQGRARRRSFRAELVVPVAIKWMAKEGSLQEEATETKVVNAHGCLVLMKAVVSEGTNIQLVNRDTSEVRSARVVWCGAVNRDGRTQVGIELHDPDPRFWGEQYVEFLLWIAVHPG